MTCFWASRSSSVISNSDDIFSPFGSGNVGPSLSSGRSPMLRDLPQVRLNVGAHVSDGVDRVDDGLGRDVPFLGDPTNLVVLVRVDAVAIWLPYFVRIVAHLTLP